eukprot:4516819-Amphidinium_carterae.1
MVRPSMKTLIQNVDAADIAQAADTTQDLDADMLVSTADSDKEDHALEDEIPLVYRQAWAILHSHAHVHAAKYAEKVELFMQIQRNFLYLEQKQLDGPELQRFQVMIKQMQG